MASQDRYLASFLLFFFPYFHHDFVLFSFLWDGLTVERKVKGKDFIGVLIFVCLHISLYELMCMDLYCFCKPNFEKMILVLLIFLVGFGWSALSFSFFSDWLKVKRHDWMERIYMHIYVYLMIYVGVRLFLCIPYRLFFGIIIDFSIKPKEFKLDFHEVNKRGIFKF